MATASNTISTKNRWNLFSACAAIEGFDDEEHDEEEVLDAFQFLINTGAAWTLQGWYGRTAANLIEQGLCSPAQQQAA